MNTPQIRYDQKSNAAYTRFSQAPISESEEVFDGIVLDFDESGRIVGLEVLDAARRLSPDVLGQAA